MHYFNFVSEKNFLLSETCGSSLVCSVALLNLSILICCRDFYTPLMRLPLDTERSSSPRRVSQSEQFERDLRNSWFLAQRRAREAVVVSLRRPSVLRVENFLSSPSSVNFLQFFLIYIVLYILFYKFLITICIKFEDSQYESLVQYSKMLYICV